MLLHLGRQAAEGGGVAGRYRVLLGQAGAGAQDFEDAAVLVSGGCTRRERNKDE